jgi:hypothetical protein
MTEREIENIRDGLFEDGYNRNREWVEKLTAGIRPPKEEVSYPVSIRLQMEKQRQLLRDILIEGNNLFPWREPAADIDKLKKELSIYADKRHSKSPGDSFSEYALDIVRRIGLYRDQEALIEIEMEQCETEKQHGQTGEDEKYSLLRDLKDGDREDKKIYNAIKRGIDGGIILVCPRGDKINFNINLSDVTFLFRRSSLKNRQIVNRILVRGEGVNDNSFRVSRSISKDEVSASWGEINKILKYD